MTRRPRILVTLDTGEKTRRGVVLPTFQLDASYVRAVERAGGTPLLVAPTESIDVQDALAQVMDALVVTGGAFDIEPHRFGEVATEHRLDAAKPERTDFEWRLTEIALARDVPILGVCGGMQLLNVVLGGTLVQDIRTEIDGALEHEQATSPREAAHEIEIDPSSALAALFPQQTARVNSTHHQAVDRLGRGLTALARAPDGIIEAVSLGDALRVLGVQWHPELLDDVLSRAIYANLIRHAAR